LCYLGQSLAQLPLLGKDLESAKAVDEWRQWKQKYGKSYATAKEENERFLAFQENLKKIQKHNQLDSASWSMALNKYSDKTYDEFRRVMCGFKPKKNGEKVETIPITSDTVASLPKEIDWRKSGYVTPVKDQGQCGSCWAFSTTGSLEGQHFRATGKLVSLSEQNLVDCSGDYGNEGCNGGLMNQSFVYIKENGGIDTEVSYPYEAQDDDCRYNASNRGANDTGFVDIPTGDENALMKAVATIGPISVAIDASGNFQGYQSGVLVDDDCGSDFDDLNHGVLVVGYGTDNSTGNAIPYWIVKNSWGPDWAGEGGYILMARNRTNQCGIATAASYPLI